ncbi:BON domain-containing protein [Rhodocaloribacter litoris]|uniref:BON domain-containing protein n=1 Tax=Rhodocaloribacter litoris TaxID=2558931 RepID=UPI00142192C9|nr:BON domain-containing protein [Rhodocaloribacter litoris]QXD15676.1 BON domain-containing protein [Rhodocaloribacter litoris]GIV61611.1 MAG: hypothetical protein KatS3mg044_0477 [Rhodothermaceae bacterium]
MSKTAFRKLTERLARPFRPLPVAETQTDRDRLLARRLYVNFERDLELADIRGIHFYVRDGIVTLYGIVRHELDRELLTSMVHQIPGVAGVVDHLETAAEAEAVPA